MHPFVFAQGSASREGNERYDDGYGDEDYYIQNSESTKESGSFSKTGRDHYGRNHVRNHDHMMDSDYDHIMNGDYDHADGRNYGHMMDDDHDHMMDGRNYGHMDNYDSRDNGEYDHCM